MSFTFTKNQTPATGSETIYLLKELLKTVGWSVKSSSDGLTYNSTGDQITSASSGAGGMDNANSWFRIQCPTMGSVTRELCYQRGAGATTARIKYSYSAGFTGGSPGITRVPSATDEQTLLGSGTDAAPTFSSLFTTNATYRAHMAAGDISDGYSFYCITYPICDGSVTNNSQMSMLCMDKISSPMTGDVDGYVFYCGSNITNFYSNNSSSPKTWIQKGAATEAFLGFSPLSLARAGTHSDDLFGVNAVSGKANIIPVIYARALTETSYHTGIKGTSYMFNISTVSRPNGATLTYLTTRDKIQFAKFLLPWDGSYALI